MLRFLLAALAVCAGAAWAASADFHSRLTWRSDQPGFGGFSGIEVAADGQTFHAITDKGRIGRGRLLRQDGRITGVADFTLTPLRNDDGGAMPDGFTDSEGLALRDDGRIYVSFEGVHRVWTYSSLTSEGAWLPRHPDFKRMQGNSSLEALAIGPDNALYAIPERSGRLNRPFPVYRYRKGEWDQPFSLPRRGPYLAVGADIFEGHIYLLERHFTGFGFRTRVRRFDLQGGAEKVLIESHTFEHGNLEGLAVWRAPEGDIRLTMVADDNFRAYQTTEIVEYSLPE